MALASLATGQRIESVVCRALRFGGWANASGGNRRPGKKTFGGIVALFALRHDSRGRADSVGVRVADG